MATKDELRSIAAASGASVTKIPSGKRGRPRKQGARHPCGKLVQVEQAPEDHASLGFATRLRELCRIAGNHAAAKGLAKDYRLNPEYLPTFLGWLGLVSTKEAQAGELIARVYGRFERAHGKRRAVQSPAYMGRVGGAGGPDDDPAIDADFHMLQDCLQPYGSQGRATVEAFWIEGRDVGSNALTQVLVVTMAVARCFAAAQNKRDRRAKRQRSPKAWRSPAEPIDLDRARRDRATTVALLEKRQARLEPARA